MPSVWRSTPVGPPPRIPAAPLRELRSVVVLARATGAICLIAAAAEVFRYVLLVRGRTEVLPVDQVRWSDALVISSGWATAMLAVVTALTFVPAIGRIDAWARHRVDVRAHLSAGRRLWWLLTPGVNLYGAGLVLAAVDATLRMPPVAVPAAPEPDRLRWRTGHLPDLERPEPPAPPDEPPSDDTPVHRSPGRTVSWWWAAWVLSGLLAIAAVIWSLTPGSLQSRANLVELHVVIDVVAAAVAFLTAAIARSWYRSMEPPSVEWPAGWRLAPPAQATGRPASPSPTTESLSSTSPLVTTQSTE